MARSNKTPQVMRLISDNGAPKEKDGSRPNNNKIKNVTGNIEPDKLIKAVPKNPALRGIEELKPPAPKPLTPEPPAPKPVESRLVHVPSELAGEQLETVLDRYNVCKCAVCVEIITEKTIAELPNMFIKVDNLEDEETLKLALDEMRPELIKILTKICIAAKIRPPHEKTS